MRKRQDSNLQPITSDSFQDYSTTNCPLFHFLPIFQITYPLFWRDKGNPFFLTSNFLTKKKILNFLSSGFLLYVMIIFYSKIISSNKSAELVCEIRGYEQLLNCWFQITTFICLLVFFIFLFFVVSLPLFPIIISNLRKVHQKSNIFFYYTNISFIFHYHTNKNKKVLF